MVVGLTADTIHTLVITATDAAGNVSAPVTRVVEQDSTAPAAPTVSTAATSTTAASVALEITAEAGSTITIAGGVLTVTETATGIAQSIAVNLQENFTNLLDVTATDASGNVSPTVTNTVARTPALSEISGKVVASDLTGAKATAITGSASTTVAVNPADGSFIIGNLDPQASSTVKVVGDNIVTSFFKAGAPGNVTATSGQATAVTPGAAGAFVQMSVLTQPVITSVSGGGDNDVNRTLTVLGTELTTTTEVWLISSTQTILLTGINQVSSIQVEATIEAGTTPGTYNVRVRMPAGLSAPSGGTVSVTAKVAFPVVTGLSQVMVVRGTSPTLVLTGTDLTGATAVAIFTDTTQVASVPPSAVTATTTKVTLPSTLAAATCKFKVTTAAGTGPFSSSFEVTAAVDVTGATEKQAITDPVTVPSAGLDAEVTLTNEGVEKAPGAATAAVQLPQGAKFTDPAGQAITEPLLPPRPVPAPVADAVAISLGLAEGRVELSVPMVMQVTTTGASGGLADPKLAPVVYLLVSAGPPAVFELAGTSGTLDGVTYIPGGVVVSETVIGGGRSEYVIGMLLIRFSTFVASSDDLIPNTVAGAPTTVSATIGDTQATVTWVAPASDGGASITNYTVTSDPGGLTATTPDGTTLTATVTGLTNGVNYTFTVVATNEEGASAPSDPSNAVTPATVPGAPTNISATIGDTESIVSWSAPVSDGGSSITSYRVTSNPASPDSPVSLGPVLTTTMTGLTNGSSTTFTIEAINAIGASAASAASNAVTPATPGTVPDSPTIGTATKGDAQATVTWSAPAFVGGSLITSYTVTSNPGALAATTPDGTTLTAAVTGLTNGVTYTFTVVATNDAGDSVASAASNSVTPATPPAIVPPVTPPFIPPFIPPVVPPEEDPVGPPPVVPPSLIVPANLVGLTIVLQLAAVGGGYPISRRHRLWAFS